MRRDGGMARQFKALSLGNCGEPAANLNVLSTNGDRKPTRKHRRAVLC